MRWQNPVFHPRRGEWASLPEGMKLPAPKKDCNFVTKLQSFLTKSAFSGINPLRGWNLLFVGRTRRMTQYTASGMHTLWNFASQGYIRRIWFHLRWHTEDFILQSRISLNLQGLLGEFSSLRAFLFLPVKYKSFILYPFSSIYGVSFNYWFAK